MRRRSFVPETPAGLEGRVLLSGAGHHPDARPLSGRYFGVLKLQTRGYFEQYALGGDAGLLKSQLQQGIKYLPYHQADQLAKKTNLIVDQMAANRAAGVPHAVRMGYKQAVAGLKADIDRRIEDGTIYVYDK